MKLTATLVAAVLALAGMACAETRSSADLAHIADIETALRVTSPDGVVGVETLAARMAEVKVPGVSIAFIEDGKVKWTRGYGLADVAAGKPVTPDTLFQAASMSKALAAVASLRLVEQGKLDLDQDINARLTGWKLPPSKFTETDKVTLRRLLSHTAGLTVHGFPGYAADQPLPTTVQILNGAAPANTAPIVSDSRPGEKWNYSGGGYTIDQLMVMEATGEPFPETIARLVLKPAGMTRATETQPLPQTRRAQAATGYKLDGQPLPWRFNTYPEYAAAGLWTTPADYGRFMIAVQDAYAGRSDKLLKPASVKAMMTPGLNRWGLGVQTGRHAGRPTFEHSGGNAGFQCYFFGFLDGSRQGAVIMTNSDRGSVIGNAVLAAMSRSYGWPDADKAP